MNTVLFDLDGTLLPLNEEEFMKIYFGGLSRKFATLGIEPKLFLKAIWTGTEAMRNNDGSHTNEDVFWNVFCDMVQGNQDELKSKIVDFYENDFDLVKASSTENPLAKKCVYLLKEKGYTVVLATNPLFPSIATYKRTTWAGLQPTDFELITTYDNSFYCKPNLNYYHGILDKINKKPEECLMIGNDVIEDMCVTSLGMDTFLLKDCLVNKEQEDLSSYKQGDFSDLYKMIESLPRLK